MAPTQSNLWADIDRSERCTYFLVGSIFAAVAMMIAAKAIYGGGWVTAFLIGVLAISWVPMNVLAIGVERRKLREVLDPRKQFYQFYFGDLLFLPGAMACLAALQTQLGRAPWEPGWWFELCGTVALVIGVLFHFLWDAPKPDGYTKGQWLSPTKIWHDLYIVPVFVFMLAYRMPLWWSRVGWGSSSFWLDLLVLLFVAGWASLMVVDGMRDPKPIKTAHPEHVWGPK